MTVSTPLPSPERREGTDPYRAFLDYLNQGASRSIRRLWGEYCVQGGAGSPVPTRRLATLMKWNTRYHWQERIGAYEQQRNKEIQAELESRRLQARLDTADLGQALRDKAADALREFAAIEEGELYEERGKGKRKKKVVIGKRFVLTAGTLTALAKAGVEIERLALGEATQRIEGAGLEQRLSEDLANMTPAERLALYRDLLREETTIEPDADDAPVAGNAAAGQ